MILYLTLAEGVTAEEISGRARARGARSGLMRKRAELVSCTDEDDLWDLADAPKVRSALEL